MKLGGYPLHADEEAEAWSGNTMSLGKGWGKNPQPGCVPLDSCPAFPTQCTCPSAFGGMLLAQKLNLPLARPSDYSPVFHIWIDVTLSRCELGQQLTIPVLLFSQ